MAKRPRGSSRRRQVAPGAASFDELVLRALDTIPARFADALDEVAVVVEDEPSRQQLRENGLGPDEGLYGLYEGVPLTEYGADWGFCRARSRSSGTRSSKTSPIRPSWNTKSGSPSSTNWRITLASARNGSTTWAWTEAASPDPRDADLRAVTAAPMAKKRKKKKKKKEKKDYHSQVSEDKA